MIEDKNSYKNIFKSTLIFGGVKVFEVLIVLIRVKIVAILLGPTGIGIQSIFQSTLSTLNQFSSLGIFQSAVRDISQSCQKGDITKSQRVITIVNRWVWLVGLLGGVACLCMSKIISQLTFGNNDYTGQFILLSLAVLFWSLSSGNIAIMQGRHQLSYLARASLIGTSISLVSTIPFYYFLGYKGIAPALVVGYLSMFIVNSFFVRKNKISKTVKISLYETFTEGKSIVKLGIILMFGNVLMTLFSFLTNAFISNFGNIQDVGLFQAAFTITYGNMVILIAIMTADYYPRLAAVNDNIDKVNLIVNQQTELLLLIIAPITIFLIIITPIAVNVLYSSEFISIIPMIRWMSIALIFRIVWHSLSYVILAKGDKKTYFIYDALLGNGLNFMLNIGAYYLWGLQGLGFSFVVGSISMSIILVCVTNLKYQFKYKRRFFLLLSLFLFLCMISYFSLYFYPNYKGYIFCLLSLLITCFISFYILNKELGLILIVKNKFGRK